MTTARVNEIDLLRFLAALSVVFFHYTFRGYAANDMTIMPYPLLAPFAKYGYLGVELFFMISGFVILMTASHGNLKSFVVSRMVRLYPAFWTCCTITFIVTLIIGAPRYSATWQQYLVNMTMLSGFIHVKFIDGAYWTLLEEMKFYGLVAILLSIRKIHQAQIFLFFWLIISVILEIFPIDKLNNLLIVDYSAYFIAGSIYYLIWSQGISITRIIMLISSWILALFESLNRVSSFQTDYHAQINAYIVVESITVFFVVMLLISLKKTGSLARKNWTTLGILTYPLYLLHQNIGYMIFNLAYPTINPHVLLLSMITVMLMVAYLVHTLIEKKVSLPMKNTLNYLLDATKRLIHKSN